jgi:hypothetical protein
MQSSLLRKIEKAKRYAQERERIHLQGLQVSFTGENDTHSVCVEDGKWSCNCDFFQGYGCCSHTMALEQIFQGFVPRSTPEFALAS